MKRMATVKHVPFKIIYTCVINGHLYTHIDGLHHLEPYTIARVLDDEGVKISRFGVHKFRQHYKELGSIDRKGGSGRPLKVTMQVKCWLTN